MIHRYLEHFKTIAECSCVSTASVKLHVSQPSLSRSIKLLEDELGVPLFIRKSRGVSLTEYGESLYRHVCFMEQEFDYAKAELSHIQNGDLRTLHIGAGLLWLFNYLPPVMAQYRTLEPEIRFEVCSGYSRNLYEQFLAGQYDVILCDLDGFQRTEGIVFEKIISVNFTLFARRDHPIFDSPVIDESCLQHYEFAIFNHSELEYLSPVQDIRRYNAIHKRQIKLITTSIVNLFESLIRSDLIASLPQQLSAYAARYDLVEISPIFRCSPFSSGAIYRSVSKRKAGIQKFIDLLRQETRRPQGELRGARISG